MIIKVTNDQGNMNNFYQQN